MENLTQQILEELDKKYPNFPTSIILNGDTIMLYSKHGLPAVEVKIETDSYGNAYLNVFEYDRKLEAKIYEKENPIGLGGP